MKRKVLLSALILTVAAIFPIYSVTAQQSPKAKDAPAAVEAAENNAAPQNEYIAHAISVTQLFDQKLQAYMQEHPDLSAEEADFHTDRLHEEARREAAGPNFLADEKNRLLEEMQDLKRDMPVISSSDSAETRSEKAAMQKKYYSIFLETCARISLMEKGSSYEANSPEEMELLKQINAFIDRCSVSDDGKALLVPEDASITPQLLPIITEAFRQTQLLRKTLTQ